MSKINLDFKLNIISKYKIHKIIHIKNIIIILDKNLFI